jgi:hypothetical protein
MEQVVRGKITAVYGTIDFEVDSRRVRPTIWTGVNPTVGDVVELTFVEGRGKRRPMLIASVSQAPDTIVVARERVCGAWASAARVEAELRAHWPADLVETWMAKARENADLTNEEINAQVDKMWAEVFRR